MLTIEIPLGKEAFDEEAQRFFYPNTIKIDLEHSLVSLSKWESFFEKSFLSTEDKTAEETLYYVESMILTPDFDSEILKLLTEENIRQINEYVEAKMTGTVFYDLKPDRGRPQIITAEIVYHWMINYGIPFECQHWHFNRLLTLIKVCIQKNSPPKKMSPQELAAHNRELNRKRKQEYGISG